MKYLLLIIILSFSFSSPAAIYYGKNKISSIKKTNHSKIKKLKKAKKKANKSTFFYVGISILAIGSVLLLISIILGWPLFSYIISIFILLLSIVFLVLSLVKSTKRNELKEKT